MSAKHTPGPWPLTMQPGHFGPDSKQFHVHCASDRGANMGNTFAIVSLGGLGAISSTKEDVEANARLIAAAPELLEALRTAPKTAHPADERGPCLCSSCEWSRNALALISRAEGRA